MSGAYYLGSESLLMRHDTRIFVAGHEGLLGSALMRVLSTSGYDNILVRSHRELDLADARAVDEFFIAEKPDCVILAAGMTGGIIANTTYPADLFHANIAIQDAVFEAARNHGTERVVFFGSSCVYPREATQPMPEDALLTGPIEATSEGYAAAKIAGLLACKAYNRQLGENRFVALLPNSMYGPNDNFDEETGHVLSSLLIRFARAAEAQRCGEDPSVVLWGSGSPRREFIYVDDVARATLFAIEHADQLENHHYNVGSGTDVSIKELAEKIASVCGYTGSVEWDTARPDGAPRKLLDSSQFLALGWKPEIDLDEGLCCAYEWLLSHDIAVRESWQRVHVR